MVYQVVAKEIASPDEAIKFSVPTEKEQPTLIACYPPTIDAMRLKVIAKPAIDADHTGSVDPTES